MDNRNIKALEFDKIREMLADNALTPAAKARARELLPLNNADLVRVARDETGDARRMLEAEGAPPLALTDELPEALKTAAAGGLLSPLQLTRVAVFANTCRRMAGYLKKCELMSIELSLNGRAFLPLEDVYEEIDAAIRGEEVVDQASNALRDARRRLAAAHEAMRGKLAQLLSAHKEWFADAYATERMGRWTLPVKAQFKALVKGAVVDKSQSGGTFFIEPAAVRAAQEEIAQLKIDEENEVRRILYLLTAVVADRAEALAQNARLMERLDFAFAKGKLSLAMAARPAEAAAEGEIVVVQGRHPLLDPARAVPLDFRIGGDTRGVVVTGPNTGGKTVALKTIGLFCLMAQCGLHIPAGEGTRLCPRDRVLVDVGDGQSISENLSTFSAHMTRVLETLTEATRQSLVLLDELGSGTDPAEGMGIAVAVLEELSARGCLFVVTTHYPELKRFAARAAGMINARMAFDPESLRPLYRLELGAAGESCAIHIARRLGFPEALLLRAREAADKKDVEPLENVSRMGAVNEPGLTHFEAPREAPPKARSYARGDSVRVYPEGQVGIVYQTTDEQGRIGVQLRGKKKLVPYKRLKRVAEAAELYPPDYDFSVIFETVENRKALHTMERKHDPNAVAVWEE